MSCCLNPNCDNPPQAESQKFCHHCRQPTGYLRHRYAPIRSLGRGGFGKTYLAEDLDKLQEKCVIKQLAPASLEPANVAKATQLFEEEAKGLQRLGLHSQIPALLAYFEENNYLYLVQEFIEGENLAQELENDRVFKEEDIWIFLRDLLHILDFVHAENTLHRDIKPDNIMRRRSDDKLVLIDFGASKQLTATTLGKSATAIGSYGYTPLEQMGYGIAYPASDLYAIGATCFHLLSGVHPGQFWHDRGYDWVDRWREYIQTPISPELTKILGRLLKQQYQLRYQTAREVLADLELLTPDRYSVNKPPNSISNLPTVQVANIDQPKLEDLVPDRWFKRQGSENSWMDKIFSFLEDR
jgi:serine/threonine protein kinase